MSRIGALMAMTLMAGLSAGGISPDELYMPREKKPKAPQFPFTDEEKSHLATLEGKAMKLFCDDCREHKEVLVKMGGLICEKCRKILAPRTSQAYQDARDEKEKALQEGLSKDLEDSD